MKRKIVSLALAGVMCLSVTACGKNTLANNFSQYGVSIYEQTVYYIGNDGRLMYYDIANESSGILCFSPNCKHEFYDPSANSSPECNAVPKSESGFYSSVCTNGLVYYTTSQNLSACLYEYDCKNDTVDMVCTVDNFEPQGLSIICLEDKIFFYGYEVKIDNLNGSDSSADWSVYCYDTQKKETEKVLTVSHISNMYLHDDEIYICAMQRNEDDENADPTFSTYKYKKGKCEKIFDESLYFYNNSKGFYETKENGVLNILEYDFKSGKTRTVAEGNPYYAYGDYLIYGIKESDDNISFFKYNSTSQKSESISFNSVVISYLDDNYVIYSEIDTYGDDQHTYICNTDNFFQNEEGKLIS
ncbi:hypothetical protein [Ruminococcus sp. Marseille-P6503]|uniref:hypothetical protein n=1 Tax=Ruminococcus sp. Marseille-P6503 TaxID=2364796 RepID=UPI000F528C9B|nr:hypothetical protein [Ruminococcus sp. Marseille-P6503]